VGEHLPNHDVFISYSNKDKSVADAICAILEEKQIRCWIAPRDISAGHSWGGSIIDAIEDARVMILVYSGNSNLSPQVVREVERAVSKGLIIVPFRIADVPMSKDMEYFLSASHWMDALTPPLEDHLARLAERVRLLLFTSDKAKASAPRTHHEAAVRPRPLAALSWIGALLACIGVVLAIGAFLWVRQYQQAGNLGGREPVIADGITPTRIQTSRSNIVAISTTVITPAAVAISSATVASIAAPTTVGTTSATATVSITSALVAATATPPGRPWTNSLGMIFMPVAGTQVQFSIWDTRVQDYQVFVTASRYAWDAPSSFTQEPTHPAVNVSWSDAKAFCAWLTERERRAGTLNSGQEYRMPTDQEWSTAVGLKDEIGATPQERRGRGETMFPWGRQWPPPHGVGNYAASLKLDDFANTSPVGSFAANRFGLYDMGGNVWQWCEDLYTAQGRTHVIRGSSWSSERAGDTPKQLMSSARGWSSNCRDSLGFRCVLACADASLPLPAPAPPAVVPSQHQPAHVNPEAVTSPPPKVRESVVDYARRLALPATQVIKLGNGVVLELTLIPTGSFVTGQPGDLREVAMGKPYYLGRYKVSQAQWQAVMRNNPSEFKGPNLPVESVNWQTCQEFLKKLQQKYPKWRFSLPTSAQWEYAARAGSTNRLYHFGDDAAELGDYAWYADNSGNTTHPLGEKKPNAWGLYDMHGNVWEWSADQSPTSDSHHLLKGGAWNRPPGALKFSSTGNYRGRISNIGLRVMMSDGRQM